MAVLAVRRVMVPVPTDRQRDLLPFRFSLRLLLRPWRRIDGWTDDSANVSIRIAPLALHDVPKSASTFFLRTSLALRSRFLQKRGFQQQVAAAESSVWCC
jgi:hypothetical protein